MIFFVFYSVATSEENGGEYRIKKGWEFVRVSPKKDTASQEKKKEPPVPHLNLDVVEQGIQEEEEKKEDKKPAETPADDDT